MRSSARGFTLIETLVALFVFSLAALALLRLQGATLRTAANLDRKMLAQIVARNEEIAALTDPSPPTLGRSDGVVANGGRNFHWTRSVTRADDPRFVRIEVVATDVAGGSPAVIDFARYAK